MSAVVCEEVPVALPEVTEDSGAEEVARDQTPVTRPYKFLYLIFYL